MVPMTNRDLYLLNISTFTGSQAQMPFMGFTLTLSTAYKANCPEGIMDKKMLYFQSLRRTLD